MKVGFIGLGIWEKPNKNLTKQVMILSLLLISRIP